MAIPGVETIIDRLGGLAPLVPLQPRGLHRQPGDARMGRAEPDAHSHSEEVDHLPWRRTVLSFLALLAPRKLSRAHLVMAAWLLSTLVIIHLPLRFQRRMMG